MIICPSCRTGPEPNPRGGDLVQFCSCHNMYRIPDEVASPDVAWRIVVDHADGMGALDLLRDGRTSLWLSKRDGGNVFAQTSEAGQGQDLVDTALDIVAAGAVLFT